MRVKIATYQGDFDRQQRIANLVIKYSVHPQIRALALELTKNCPSYDQLCEIKRIFDWVKKYIRYIEDVAFIESYHSPVRILELGQGDCDDFTILTDALLTSIGFITGAKIVAKRKDIEFHHIYPVVLYPKKCKSMIDIEGNVVWLPPQCKLIPLDPSVKTLGCCQEVPHEKERVFLYLPKHIVELVAAS